MKRMGRVKAAKRRKDADGKPAFVRRMSGRNWLRGLTARLLVFNLLLAVFPIGAVFFLGTYESQLLDSQERAMVQQGRLLASALAGGDLAEEAAAILNRLGARTDARLRVLDSSGHLLADSAQSAGSKQSAGPETGTEEASTAASSLEENFIYRIGALPARTLRRINGFARPPSAPDVEAEYYSGREILDGPEIEAALNGRYGAATRISTGQKSVTLYSAIPIMVDDTVAGAVLVSRSTFAILSNLYSLRLDITKIFLISIAAAVVLSILLARTVTVPVGRLRDQAESILDERGKLQDRFRPLSGKDEVAHLSRALYRLSSRLQERTDYMEDFMADLVHELKNPVAGILSAAELAEESEAAQTPRFLEIITREGNRIRRLLNDLKEIISVDVRLDKGTKKQADVCGILKTLAAGHPGSSRRNVRLELISSIPENTVADIHPDRLAQAVLNLIDNAVSFSPDNSTVQIALNLTADKRLHIDVADRGPGIAPGDARKIFERWYTDRPADESSRHSGLGLAIVKGIAEGFGGSVRASAREGGGTVFRLELPVT